MTTAYLIDNPPHRRQFRAARRAAVTGAIVRPVWDLRPELNGLIQAGTVRFADTHEPMTSTLVQQSSEPGAALTAPALANTYGRGASVSDRTCSIEGCTNPSCHRGWCKAHYLRWHKYGDPLAWRNAPTPATERFWAKVDTTGDCWVWTAAVNASGYGRMQIGSRAGGVVLAHRFSWQLATGIDPSDLCVLHLCDNPPCVNPDHLVLGTRAANVLDMVNKGRQKGKH